MSTNLRAYCEAFEFLCMNPGNEKECYEQFKDKVYNENELKEFIKNVVEL